MSADNTIIVLETQGQNGTRQYRVAHVQNAENLHEEPNYPPHAPVLNREAALDFFGGCYFFTDPGIAQREAEGMLAEIEGDGGYVEYGICYEEHPAIFFPATDRKRKRRQRRFRRRVSASATD